MARQSVIGNGLEPDGGAVEICGLQNLVLSKSLSPACLLESPNALIL